MPHIFPRRFLRTRDVLDPTDFNEDFHPVYDVLQGRLDRTNFNAGNLKTNLRPHPDSETPEPTGPSVAEGAYFKTHVSQIESRFEFWEGSSYDSVRRPLNFVELDGSTFRDFYGFTGSNPNAYPSIVPNHGAWSAVKTADLSDSQKLTFTTGHSKIWVSAYAQYIWQGFFEYKAPWVPGLRRRGSDIDAPPEGDSWAGHHGVGAVAVNERRSMNTIGPTKTYEVLPTVFTENETENIEIQDKSFAFPLNEQTKWTAFTGSEETERPHRQGYHHISQGFNPCLLQFAIRLDGKIIEETITGKRLPYEESPHGLRVSDGIRTKDEDELLKDEWSTVLGSSYLDETFSTIGQITGQRSWGVTSTIGETKDSRPGQKVKSSRSVSYGPEVIPTRLGAVVEVQPGEHTIELCVRRLQRKKGKFKKGDFVGIFSRRLLAFDLPIHPSRTPTDSSGSGESEFIFDPMSKIPTFKTETEVVDDNLVDVRTTLANGLNKIPDSSLDDEVLTNKYLPSKVVYTETSTIIPGLTVDEFTGTFNSSSDAASSEAIYPGYKLGDTIANNVVPRSDSGWRTADGTSFPSTSRLGWFQLNHPGANKLSITAPATEQVLRPHEQLILMMDVEVRGIEPLYSDGALDVLNMMSKFTDGVKLRKLARDFLPYCLAERYLDLFAMFAIGYKEDGSWIISTDSAPSVVNSFNWLNRSATFDASLNVVNLPLKRLGQNNYWDVNPGWTEDGGVGRVEEFYEDDDEDSFFISSTSGVGGNLVRSNLGINIPIMQVIENTGSTDRVISEFGGFTNTMFPTIWEGGYGPDNPRKWLVDVGLVGVGGSGIFEAEKGAFDLLVERQWASPVGGRDILQGVKIHYGNSRLTAIKVTK
jgi:hypothetical protein